VYRLANRIFWFVCRFLLRLRYRVQLSGHEKLRELDGATLVMPNHPGYVDPALVLSHIRLKNPLRPLVFEGSYRITILYPIMQLIGAVEVPDLAEHSQSARDEAFKMIDSIAEALHRGDNVLIYPSGRLQRRGSEVVGATRAAAELLRRCPHANVVLLRTRGVWGSMFSFAQTGRLPELGRCVARGLVWTFLSLLFFLPRRRVTMTIEVVPRERLPEPTRETLNPFLEEWYNRGAPESPTFVRLNHFFGPSDFDFPDLDHRVEIDFDKIKSATVDGVNEMVEEHLDRPLDATERVADTTLDQLGLDSLDRMDIALEIEQRFHFRSDRVASTLGELWALAEGLLEDLPDVEAPPPALWNRPLKNDRCGEILSETLAEAFVRRAQLYPNDVAVADELSGPLTYRKLLIGASLLGKRFARLEGDAVGIMLPAAVATDIAFMGLHLAGKLPVMLNWTTGPKNLAHAIRTMQIKHVVTSRRFIDRLGVEVEGADFAYLEDLRGDVGRLEPVMTLLSTYLFPGRWLRRVPVPDADEPAVVLFTSGSESAPKAVPLSHRNLITNVRAGCKILEPTRTDTLLAFLPPFHSFGLTGNLLVSLLTGLRMIHHPDPTDAAGLVRTIARYRATLLFSTPTFLGYMLARATPDDFASVRIIVTGAEKCPDTVWEACREIAPQAILSEGYGITECSPIVSVGRPGYVKLGTLGQTVEGVEVCVVDPDQRTPLPTGETGLILVTGPSIFHGYLNYDGPNPFVEMSGRRWYNTGDLGAVDEEGYIHFRGRLKRFLKAGGEMVSLPALEEPLARRFPPTEDGPQVGVEGVETADGRRIVLFSTVEIPLREANAILAEAGFRGVMRLDESRRIDAIPVLGTGKTDYKLLRKMVTESLEPQ
jgi:long-chain-fatty-acid--[acyl-carrier-protein] ligase